MEILGIGPLEFVFIVIIALILMGPKDMEKAGRTLGNWLNRLVKSDTWKVMRETSKEIRGLPTRLMREANLEDMQKGLDGNSILPPKPDNPKTGKSAPVPPPPATTVDSPPPPARSQPPATVSQPARPAAKTPKKPAAQKKTTSPSKTATPKKKETARKPASGTRRGSHA
jgi:sec-independent protein translocase protein TatB